MMENETRTYPGYRGTATLGVADETEKRLPQVQAEAERLEKAAQFLSESVSRLEERLGSVLGEDRPQPALVGEALRQAPPCPLANRLAGTRQQLDQAGQSLAGLLSRLEV